MPGRRSIHDLVPATPAGGLPLERAALRATQRMARQVERAEGKAGLAFDPATAQSGQANYGQVEKPRDTPPFAFLRAMRKKSMIDQAIIDIRLAQARAVAKRCRDPEREIGWRIRHRFADNPQVANDPNVLKRAAELEQLFEGTLNRAWHPTGLRSVIISAVEDELVMDRRVMVYENLDAKGRPWGWHMVAPETIKPRIDLILPEMERLYPASTQTAMATMPNLAAVAAESLSDSLGFDLTQAAYVQEIYGRPVAAWSADEIEVDYIYATTELNRWGYGTSPLEKSLWWSLSFMLAAQYNTDLFKQNYPQALLLWHGDFESEGLQDLKKQLASEANGAWKLPIIEADSETEIELKTLRDNPRDMLFSQWMKMLTSYKAACYRMSPDLLNFDLVRGSDQTLFQRGNNEARVTLSQEEGFHSILYNLGEFFSRFIARHDPDFVFEWIGFNQQTPAERAALANQQLMYMTPNEVRAQTGELPPLQGEDGDIGDRLLSPVAIQLRTATAQVEQIQMGLQRQQIDIQVAMAEAKVQLFQLAQQQAEIKQMVAASRAQPQAAKESEAPAKEAKQANEAPPSAGGRPHRAPTGAAPKQKAPGQ